MLDSNRKYHWEQVYQNKIATEVSWYQQHPECSLELVQACGVGGTARIIDIGAGASTLVDYLLAAGYQNLTVLDIARGAIEQARSRLGKHADRVVWLEHDITRLDTTTLVADGKYDIWHDRAVFHFLTDPHDQEKYVSAVCCALKPGAQLIMATFGLDGPEKCSGLEIVRYSPETISAMLGDSFQLIETRTEKHVTPSSALQNFIYCRFIRL